MLINSVLEARKHAAALLISLALLAGLFGLAQQADADDSPANLSPLAAGERAPDMVPNFQRVCSGIWRGSAPSHAALNALAHDGVKTIVDLRMDGTGVDNEKTTAHKLGINYYHYSLGFKKPSADKVHDILAVMTDPVNQPVFIHCRQGADRTGMLCGIYRRVWEGWSFKRTYQEMRQHHFKPFLLTMRRQVKNANLDQSIIGVQAKHPALIAAANSAIPASTEATASSSTGASTTISVSKASQTAPNAVPDRNATPTSNLLVVEPHRNVN